MKLRMRVLINVGITSALAAGGCRPSSTGSSVHNEPVSSCPAKASLRFFLDQTTVATEADANALRTGALAVGTDMVSDLCQQLAADHGTTAAATVAEGARVEMNAAVGSLIIVTEDGTVTLSRFMAETLPPAQVVAGPVLRGAYLRLTRPELSLDDISTRLAFAQDIIEGASFALNEVPVTMTTSERLDTMSDLANAAVKTLPDASLAGDSSQESVAAVTKTAVGSLPQAGIGEDDLSEGAQKLAEGAVSALTTSGFDPKAISTLTGEVAGSALQGLSTAGLSAEKIIEAGAIESIINGATAGLKKNETAASTAVDAIGSMAGAAVGALSKVGISSPELQKGALAAVVKSSLSVAQNLSSSTSDTVASAMSAVASQAVLALTAGGFESNQIGTAISTIVSTGVAELAKNTSTSSAATSIASKIIEGALTGAGTLIQSGSLGSDQATELARSASTGAVEGLQSLQTAGIVTGDAVSVFTSTIVNSVSSGLEKSGADATVVAQAQSGANTVVTSEAVQQQIQANAGTAEAVVKPVFSLAAGTYTTAQSVTISTTTSGASIRYTLDGSTPNATTGTLYTGALTLTSSKTLKAIAYKTGWSNSEVASITYTLNIPLFGTPLVFTTGNNPEGLAAGDFNGDGKMDLAVGLYNGKGVSFLLGNGAGSFGTNQDMANSPNSAGSFTTILTASVAVGDINGDGKDDAVWGSWGNNFLSVLTNTTSTNATALSWANGKPTGYDPGISGPRGVAITDVDNDGLSDILVGEANGNRLIVYLNQSGSVGTFSKFGNDWLWNPDTTVYNGNAHPWMVAVADFNADGKPDVVGGGGYAGIVSVLLNATTASGTPAFQTANRFNLTQAPYACTSNASVSVADFNDDDKPDFIASCPTSGLDKIALFVNTTATNATAATFTVSSFDSADALMAVTSGDVNGDNKADVIAITNTSPNNLVVYRDNGDGTFAAAENFAIGNGTGPNRVLLVDVNGDNRLDAVVSNGSSNQVTVFLNQSTN